MQREIKIPTEPRFEFVTHRAYSYLLEFGYSRFPISPFDVLKKLSDTVTCIPWSKACTILKSSDPFHLREVNADARTIHLRDTGQYLVVYDNVEVKSTDRIAWIIMHEIGHILLGHLVGFDETAHDRGALTKDGYGV